MFVVIPVGSNDEPPSENMQLPPTFEKIRFMIHQVAASISDSAFSKSLWSLFLKINLHARGSNDTGG